jgi:hypothetical protein
MSSAGLPTGPGVQDWTPPPTVEERLTALESGGGGGGGLTDGSVTLSKLSSLAKTSLKGVVVDTGSGYGARPSGFASVEFVGPDDPDTLATDNDTWVPTTA